MNHRSSFRPYPTYRRCASGWLDSVPEHWALGPIKHFVLPKAGAIKTGPFGSQLTAGDMLTGTIKVYNQRTVIDANFEVGENYISAAKFRELSAFEVFPGDVLVTTRGTIGRTAIMPDACDRGILHPCLLRIQVDVSVLTRKFLQTLIQDSDVIKRQIGILSNATTIEVIYSGTMANLIIPVPPPTEQKVIMSFLDSETAKIDQLIQKQERLIELLQEKRQAVISHAVTKGLDPNVPMKNSGIEWLGEVPAHWDTIAIKRMTPVKRGASPRPIDDPVYFDENGEFGWVRISDVTRAGAYLVETEQRLSALGASLSVKLEPGSLFLSIAGSVGKATIAKDKVCIHDGFVYFPSLCVNPRWLYQIFDLGLPFAGLGKLGTQLNLNTDTVGSIVVPLPSSAEIEGILRFIDSETSKIDILITKANQSIELMKERRSALISAAVTGKIDVREAA